MRKWTHAHSLGIGALFGVTASQHVWLIGVLCLVAGVLVGRFWHSLGRGAAKAGSLVHERILTERERRAEVRSRRRRNLEVARTKRSDLQRAEERGFWKGVASK